MIADHEILTLEEVAAMLRISRHTLYRLARAGKIPSFRIGDDWRFRKDLIKRWIAQQTVG
jgi:excisionase family DNA binding protein